MSNFLRTVAARGLAAAPASVRPRLRSRFEPASASAPWLPATPVLTHLTAGAPDPADEPTAPTTMVMPATTVTAGTAGTASSLVAGRPADRIPASGQVPPDQGHLVDRPGSTAPADPAVLRRLVTPVSGHAQSGPATMPPGPGEPSGPGRSSTGAEVPAVVPRPARWSAASAPSLVQQGAPDVVGTYGSATAMVPSGREPATPARAADPPGNADTAGPGPRTSHLTTIVERTAAGPPHHSVPIAPALRPEPPREQTAMLLGAAQPSVSVTIGRVDVVAVVEPAAPPPAARPQPRPPAPSLEEYLRERTRRSR